MGKTYLNDFRSTVDSFADKTALMDDDESMTYRQLDALSDRVAAKLIAGGTKRGDIVPIRMRRSAKSVAAILGVLKAGGAVAYISAHDPEGRVQYIMEDTGARQLIEESFFHELPVDAAIGAVQHEEDDPALIVYTSGSTGRPKGVVISHKAMRMSVTSSTLERRADDVAGIFSPFSFVVVIPTLLTSLYLGCTIHIAPEDVANDAAKVVEYIHAHEITALFLSPSMAGFVLPRAEDQLRILFTGSDKVRGIYSDKVQVFNTYGASETCCLATSFLIDRPYADRTPVGKPLVGIQIHVMDKNLKQVPAGQTGEICVAGRLSSGYLHKPELTKEAFVLNPLATSDEDRTLYKTGDLGFVDENGNLVFVSRISRMLKVRGNRVDPGEIEGVTREIDGVTAAAVIGFNNAAGETALYTIYVADEDVTPAQIRDFLAGRLPSYMVPAWIDRVEALPLNANGKTDYKAIKAPDAAKFRAPFEQPAEGAERAIAQAFEQILGVSHVGALDDFNLLGGDSISANMVAAKLPDLPISASDIMNIATPRGLAQIAGSAFAKAEEREDWPLTFAERQMATEQGLEPDSVSYNINFEAFRIKGEFDEERMQKALDELVARHDVLRSYYPMEHGEYVHRIKDELRVPIERIACAPKDLASEIAKTNTPFDLATAPLIRAHIFEHGDDDRTLHFTIHHIIMDGASWTTFQNELFDLYNGKELEPVAHQFQDYAVWQQENANLAPGEQMFRAMFADGVPETEMPTRGFRPEMLPAADTDIEVALPMEQITAAAKRFGVTTYEFLMAALGMTLARYTGTEDVVVGTAMSGRTLKEQKGMMGMFVNTVPVRVKPTGDMSFEDYVLETARTVRAVKENQTYPFEKLVPALAPDRNASRSPVFDVMFNYLYDAPSPQIEGAEVSVPHFKRQALNMDLMLEVITDGKNARLILSYSPILYHEEVARNFMEQLTTTLDRLINANGAEQVMDLSELPEGQKRQILEDFAGPRSDTNVGKTVVDLFREQAARIPDKRAVFYEGEDLTYAQLDQITDQFAAYLASKGLGRGDVAGIMVHRGLMMPIGALSVMKTGAAYLPMDPAYPAERLQYMTEDAKAKFIIADEDLMDRVPGFKGEWIDAKEAFKERADLPVPQGPAPEDLYILLYTSGTTGNPKGVMLRHANLAQFLGFYNRMYDLSPEDNIPAYASFGFDANMMDMYPALTSGAGLYIIPEEMRLDLPGLRKYFEDNDITVVFMTTQLGRQFAEGGTCGKVRALSTGGESLTPITPPPFKFYNLYGPTECTIFTTRYEVDRLYDRVPIGKPVDNTSLYITDTRGRLAPVGTAGELNIAGRSVAAGYLNRPDLTEEKFALNPFSEDPDYARMYRTGDVVRFLPSGDIDFVGRRDFQVKIRGFRVELTEIEGRIREYLGIKDAAVIAVDDAGGGKRVVAYIVSDDTVDIPKLNAFIEESLPVYMVPAATMQIERIPLNPNGKVDRRKLPKVTIQAEEIVEPRNDMERTIFDVVAGILGTDEFGVTTNLTYAGLNSLSSIKAAALITEKTGRVLKTADLLAAKTIEKIAKKLEDSEVYERETFEKKDAYPLTQNQLGLYFACVKDPGTLVYNIPFELSFTRAVDPQKLAQAVRTVIEAHPYVKTHFAMQDNAPVQLRLDDRAVDVPVVQCTPEEFVQQRDHFVRPFNFFEGPLFRLAIYVTPENVYLLGDFHHMIFDGGSFDIFLRDLADAYNGKPVAAETFTSFDLAARQSEKNTDEAQSRARAFYAQKISDGEGATKIPPDHERAETGSPQTVRAKIRKNEVLDAIRGLGVTPSNLFLAATALATGRYASTHDVRIAAITNGREGVDVQNNLGMLVETLPMILYPNADTTAGRFLTDTQQTMTQTLDNCAYSYLQAASDYGYDAQIMYAYQGGVVNEYNLGGQTVSYSTLGLDRAKFPVSINVQEDDEYFTVEAEYDDSVFSEGLMDAFANSIVGSARALCADPDAKLGSLSVQTQEQKAQTESFNRPIEPVAGTNLFRIFEGWAERTPDAPALYADGKELTYKELNEQGNRLAHALIQRGVQRGDRVAFVLGRDYRIPVAMLGIMKSGAAYIPVDPEYPKERIAHVLEDSGAKYILTSGASELANALDINELLACEDTMNPGVPVRQSDLCYIIYTSGSTGRPKGVMINHGNIMNYVKNVPENVPAHTLAANGCSMVSVTTVSFDMFLKEAFTTLMNGLRLILANDEEAKNPDQLAALFKKTGGNAFNATPSRMMQYMALPEMKEALAGCRVIMAGGEGYPPALYDKLRSVTDAILINTYGPTETTVSSNGKILENDRISIGRPLYGVREQIVDIDGQPLPALVTGELWISGNGVAPGYFGNPEMTEQQFVHKDGVRFYKSGDLARWTEDGDVQILGRNDGQIKLRGLRIELGEIERVIAAYPGITGVVVLVRRLHGTDQLCAYYTADSAIEPEVLRDAIAQSLARYMVPAAYLQLDEMPMTPNGKIDRKNLPEPKLMRREEYVAPESEAEKAYADIFAGILQLERVGATDSFFDLGGTSLLVTQVTIEAAKKGMHISYADVFANPSPRELAALEEGGEQTKPSADEITEYDYTAIQDMLASNTIASLRCEKPQELGNVCITGATGFLGIHVLREFLRSEKGTAYCVVRGGKLSAEERLKNMLVYYFSDSFDDLFESRIVVVPGDVTDEKTFEALEKYPIDTLINCAANVKHFSAGTDIEDVNLGGAKNAIAFCEKKKCNFVQVSTASIAGMSIDGQPGVDVVLDETMLYFGQDLSNKYTNSKFLAERATLEAASRGLNAKIMRVGNLMAREEDGEFQANFKTNNFLGRLKAYQIIGKVPYRDLGINAEFAPIDSTARAILTLAKTPVQCRVFHPYNDHTVYIGDVIASLRAMGIEIEPVEQEEYDEAYSQAMMDKNKARHLNSLIAYQEYGKCVVPIGSTNAYTSQALARAGFFWPITGKDYLENFFDTMIGLGFFDEDRPM